MAKFKEGDTIRVVNGSDDWPVGGLWEVIRVDSIYYTVNCKDDPYRTEDFGVHYENDFELVQDKFPEQLAPKLWAAYKDRLNDEALEALRQVICDVDNHENLDFSDEEDICTAFYYRNTPQGVMFWGDVNAGVYDLVPQSEHHANTPNEDTGSAATSSHYNAQSVQPIELMQMTLSASEFVGFLKGNIMKYAMRAGSKQGESDSKDWRKAEQYKMWLDLAQLGETIDPRKDVV